jgi:hypothetical protein
MLRLPQHNQMRGIKCLMASHNTPFQDLCHQLRHLFDEELLPRMRNGELDIEIFPPKDHSFGNCVSPVVIAIRGSSALLVAEQRDKLARQISEAFTVHLPALGIVDLSQQGKHDHRTITINCFTEAGDNEFLRRIRDVKAAKGVDNGHRK